MLFFHEIASQFVYCLNFVLYTESFYDFYFKVILKESCYHKTYLSTRKVLCVLILIALQTLLNLKKKMIAFMDCKGEILLNMLAPEIQYISVVQLFAKDEKQQGKKAKTKRA